MTPERWAKIRQTFEAALDKPAKDRSVFLHFVCGADEDLRLEVEALLHSHNESGDFLDSPVVQLADFIAADSVLAETLEHGASGKGLARTGDNLQGYRVGPYEFERCIGRGGMGSVWLATRSDREYKKKVAVKVVRHGMDSQEILRRFRMERQMLANLEHPNIARLIDGGSTPEGMPFLVMEYVEGTPIDQYCESHQLTVNQRLELFRQVCASVQYAHQNLIVHRDIKSGNILVNFEGVPKLLDFGIAKLVSRDNANLSSVSVDLSQTLPHLRPMTLDYASPEQVRGDLITTATDVYSLGVLLYKLLCGKMPYGNEAHSFATMQYAIREQDTLRPSIAVMTGDNGIIPQATQRIKIPEDETREAARRRLRNKLAGDLDAIVLKAMQKDPQQRYASPDHLSEDIRRYLEIMPIKARPDTPGYRFTKLIRRNRAASIAASVLSVAMVVTTVASYTYAQSSKVERRSEATRDLTLRRQLMRAQNELGKAKLAANDYTTAYESFNQALAAAQELWGMESELSTGPTAATRLMLGEANANLGKVLLESGATQSALEKLTKARDYYQQMLASEGMDKGTQQDTSLEVREALQSVIALMAKARAPVVGRPASPIEALPSRRLPSQLELMNGIGVPASAVPENAAPQNARPADKPAGAEPATQR